MTSLLGQDEVFKQRLEAYSKKNDDRLSTRTWCVSLASPCHA